MIDYKLHNDCKFLSQRVYSENKSLGTNGWIHKGTFINPKSGYYTEIYEKDGKVIFAVRGTEGKWTEKEFSKDFMNDTSMLLSFLPKQMKDAEEAYLAMVKKYGKENVILTGHSLGGSIVQILGAKYGAQTVTFSAFGTRNLRGVEINSTKNITNYGMIEDGIFRFNLDKQIGKTFIIDAKNNYSINDKEDKHYYHRLENYGDLSNGEEYNENDVDKEIIPKFVKNYK